MPLDLDTDLNMRLANIRKDVVSYCRSTLGFQGSRDLGHRNGDAGHAMFG
jgi:hypothetical protein